jgi:pyruvate/2-oxoglutarate dehydrogenase complex dihydrolipoamide dehydrogenase (E3) component
MELGSVPEHLVVLGGGFIGLEFAQMFRRFGAEVSILEASKRLVAREDQDISDAVGGILGEDGISLHTETEAVGVSPTPSGVRVDLKGPGGGAWSIDGSHLLLAVGRVPNTESLGLVSAGLEVDQRGYLPVDDRCRTDVEGVWGLGDVTGAPPFTHVAYDDFRVVRSQLLGDGSHTRKGRIATYTLFTDPELGRVGLTEREAREGGYDVRVATLPMAKVARAMETGETRGLMKAVIDAQRDTILGASILGVHGGEIASVLLAAMMGGLTCTALRDGVFSHPTLAESLNNLFATTQ